MWQGRVQSVLRVRRFPQCFASDESWFAINCFAAKRMLVASLPLVAIGIVSLFLPLKTHPDAAILLGFAASHLRPCTGNCHLAICAAIWEERLTQRLYRFQPGRRIHLLTPLKVSLAAAARGRDNAAMEAEPSKPDQPSPRRRFQFRLRTLMIVVTLLRGCVRLRVARGGIAKERREAVETYEPFRQTVKQSGGGGLEYSSRTVLIEHLGHCDGSARLATGGSSCPATHRQMK